MAKICASCGKKLGLLSQYTNLKDGYLCGDCYQKYGIFQHVNDRNMTQWLETITWNQCQELITDPKKLEQAKVEHGYSKHIFESVDEAKAKEKQLLEKSKITDAKIAKQQAEEQKALDKYKKMLPIFKEEKTAQFSHFIFDDKRQQILQKKTLLDGPRFINYSDIISYRINEHGHNDNKHHGIARALVGGSVGAIVGATTGMKQTDYIGHLGLIVNLKDGTNFEVVEIRRIDQVKSGSFSARVSINEINRLISKLDAIIAQNKSTSNVVANNENTKKVNQIDKVAEELTKYKKLLDQNAITQEEYEKIKNKLLDL